MTRVNLLDLVEGVLAPEEIIEGFDAETYYYGPVDYGEDFSVILDLHTGVVYSVTGPDAMFAVLEGAPDEP